MIRPHLLFFIFVARCVTASQFLTSDTFLCGLPVVGSHFVRHVQACESHAPHHGAAADIFLRHARNFSLPFRFSLLFSGFATPFSASFTSSALARSQITPFSLGKAPLLPCMQCWLLFSLSSGKSHLLPAFFFVILSQFQRSVHRAASSESPHLQVAARTAAAGVDGSRRR
jgi:hypothetical protein